MSTIRQTKTIKYLIAVVIIAVIVFGILIVNKVIKGQDIQQPLIEEIHDKSNIKQFEEEFPDSNIKTETFDIQDETTLLKKLKIDCGYNFEPGMFYKTTTINKEKTEQQITWTDYNTKEVICEYRELIIDESLPEPLLILEAYPSLDKELQYTFELTEEQARKIAGNIFHLDINFEFDGERTGTFRFNKLPIDMGVIAIRTLVRTGTNYIEIDEELAVKITKMRVVLS